MKISHILKIALVVTLLLMTLPVNAQEVLGEYQLAVVIIPAKGQEVGIEQYARDILVTTVASDLNQDPSTIGNTLFTRKLIEEIRECFKSTECVCTEAIEQVAYRVLYGTIGKYKIKEKSRDGKIKKGKEKTVFTIKLVFLDVNNNKIIETFACKKCSKETLSKQLETIGHAVSENIRKNPVQLAPDTSLTDLATLATTKQPAANPPIPKRSDKPNFKPLDTDNQNWQLLGSIALIGISVGMLSTGGYFGIQAQTAQSDYNNTNIQKEAFAFYNQYQTASNRANILFATGGALAATGVTIFVLDKFGIISLQEKKPLQTIILPGNSSVDLHFSF